jgi:hypothetical protein
MGPKRITNIAPLPVTSQTSRTSERASVTLGLTAVAKHRKKLELLALRESGGKLDALLVQLLAVV